MTTPTLDSARLKLGRAEELLEELRDEIGASQKKIKAREIELGRPSVEIETRREGPWLVTICKAIHVRPEVRWGLLAGDAMHNTRSALDHLACRLVELAGNAPSNRTAFPIWSEAPHGKEKKKQFESLIRGMSSQHKASLRALQPYRHPDTWESDMLIALAAMDNADKHKLLVPLYATLTEDALKASPSVPGGRVGVQWNLNAAIEPGVEILRIRGLPGPRTGALANVAMGIAFGDPRYGRRELEKIRAYVVGIVESFAPEFR